MPAWWGPRARRWTAAAALTAVTAAAAYTARWVRDAVESQPLLPVPASPAATNPAAARAQQRLADTWLWRRIEGRIAARALRPFRVQPGLEPLRVLNLDHGPGGVAAALAAQAPQDALVVATDAVPGMATLAAHRASRRGVRAALRFVQASPVALPFASEAFHLVVSAGGMHQWQRPQAALEELRRVLAPGGRYLVLDGRRDMPSALWVLVQLVQRRLAPRDLRAIDEPSASLRASYAPREVEWLAARAGLPDLQVRAGSWWVALERGDPAQPDQSQHEPDQSQHEPDQSQHEPDQSQHERNRAPEP